MFERAYKYRFYPTEEQADQLARTFGCVRVVYNWALDLKQQTWRQHQENLSYAQLSAGLTTLKKEPEYTWLNEVSCVPLQQTLRHLDRAYRNFFDQRAGYPSFKRKYHRQTAEFTRSAFTYQEGHLALAKIGSLDVRWSRSFSGTPSTVTVSCDTVGRYFVSILCASWPTRPAGIGARSRWSGAFFLARSDVVSVTISSRPCRCRCGSGPVRLVAYCTIAISTPHVIFGPKDFRS